MVQISVLVLVPHVIDSVYVAIGNTHDLTCRYDLRLDTPGFILLPGFYLLWYDVCQSHCLILAAYLVVNGMAKFDVVGCIM